jgi:hypothetical protein
LILKGRNFWRAADEDFSESEMQSFSKSIDSGLEIFCGNGLQGCHSYSSWVSKNSSPSACKHFSSYCAVPSSAKK